MGAPPKSPPASARGATQNWRAVVVVGGEIGVTGPLARPWRLRAASGFNAFAFLVASWPRCWATVALRSSAGSLRGEVVAARGVWLQRAQGGRLWRARDGCATTDRAWPIACVSPALRLHALVLQTSVCVCVCVFKSLARHGCVRGRVRQWSGGCVCVYEFGEAVRPHGTECREASRIVSHVIRRCRNIVTEKRWASGELLRSGVSHMWGRHGSRPFRLLAQFRTRVQGIRKAFLHIDVWQVSLHGRLGLQC